MLAVNANSSSVLHKSGYSPRETAVKSKTTGTALVHAILVLESWLVACASSSPPPDREAEQACDRLVSILSADKLIAASNDWPVVNGVPSTSGRSHSFYSGVPQDYLPPVAGDLPHFWVWGHAGASEFWILKMEGPAGASTWYGPLVLDHAGHPTAADAPR